ILTSGTQPGDSARCRELRISSRLMKPVTRADLLEALIKALQLSFEINRKQATVPQAVTRDSRRSLKLLLAEDNAVNQQLAVRILEKNGHQVTLVGNGREAVDAWERQTFDLILMDVQMPEMDGFEATGTIRNREQKTGKHTPILAMTAHA